MAKVYTLQTLLSAPASASATPAAGGSLTADTTYYYRVIAASGGGGTGSNYFNSFSPACAEFSALTTTDNKTINLAWDAVGGAASYLVFRSTSSGGPYTGTNYIRNDANQVYYYPTTQTNSFSDDGTNNLDTGYFFEDGLPFWRFDGGTSGDPITLSNIYAAAVSNGWTAYITNPAPGVYIIKGDTNFGLNDASTHFKMDNGEILIHRYGNLHFSGVNGSIVLGNVGSYGPDRGCLIWIESYHDYSSFIANGPSLVAYQAEFRGQMGTSSPYYINSRCNVTSHDFMLTSNKAFILDKCTLTHGWRAFAWRGGAQSTITTSECLFNAGYYPYTTNTILLSDMTFYGSVEQSLLVSYSYVYSSFYFTRLTCRDSLRDIQIQGYTTPPTSTIYLRDIDWMDQTNNIPIILWAMDCSNLTVNEYFTNDFLILDTNNTPIVGASIEIVDENGASVASKTTDANGKVAGFYLLCRTYARGDGLTTGNTYTTTRVDKTFTMKISKSGYKTYTSKFNLTKKKSWIITLSKVKDLNFSKHAVFSTQ